MHPTHTQLRSLETHEAVSLSTFYADQVAAPAVLPKNRDAVFGSSHARENGREARRTKKQSLPKRWKSAEELFAEYVFSWKAEGVCDLKPAEARAVHRAISADIKAKLKSGDVSKADFTKFEQQAAADRERYNAEVHAWNERNPDDPLIFGKDGAARKRTQKRPLLNAKSSPKSRLTAKTNASDHQSMGVKNSLTAARRGPRSAKPALGKQAQQKGAAEGWDWDSSSGSEGDEDEDGSLTSSSGATASESVSVSSDDGEDAQTAEHNHMLRPSCFKAKDQRDKPGAQKIPQAGVSPEARQDPHRRQLRSRVVKKLASTGLGGPENRSPGAKTAGGKAQGSTRAPQRKSRQAQPLRQPLRSSLKQNQAVTMPAEAATASTSMGGYSGEYDVCDTDEELS